MSNKYRANVVFQSPKEVETTLSDNFLAVSSGSGNSSRNASPLPTVSIIVPVYNDPEGVKQTLDCLVQQSYPQDKHEIIVVDNNSTDDTRLAVKEYCHRWNHIKLEIEDKIQSSYAARNTGIDSANGEICTFIDADMIVERGWLQSIVDRIVEDDIEYLGCSVEITIPPDTNSVFARYNKQTGFPIEADIEQKRFAPTCCLSVRKSVFEDIGLFDARLTSGGDLEFGNRVHQSGRKLHYADSITQYHPARSSFRALAKKSIRQGRGVGQLQKYYPERYGPVGIPPRPRGPFVRKKNSSPISFGERIVFSVLTILFIIIRGTGYYMEIFSNSIRGR